MLIIVESGAAELALRTLREEMGKPSNTLEQPFLLVDGEVDYTKDLHAMTPTGLARSPTRHVEEGERYGTDHRRRPVQRHP